jgi:uncharacterized damage-inducible protein DinB
MSLQLSVPDLVAYSDWERQLWEAWFGQHGADALRVSTGPNGDGRFKVVGEVVRHIFSAEKRYVERLKGLPLTDTTSIPTDDVAALFRFSRESRNDLRQLLATFPDEAWDVPRDFTILKYSIRATPRKIVIHTLVHEIRHWAQIATLLRLQGLKGEAHDFLMSPAS